MTLILASSSPCRRRLLRESGLSFQIFSPNVDESLRPGESPGVHVRGRRLIEGVEGSFTNVVGLPLEALRKLLGAYGIALPAAPLRRARRERRGARVPSLTSRRRVLKCNLEGERDLRNSKDDMSEMRGGRKMARKCLGLWCAVMLIPLFPGGPTGKARADVTVERYTKTGGLAGIGASESTTVEKISGLRKRETGTMKMTGFLGKMAGDMSNDSITIIPKDAVWKLDHKKKTYTESPITMPSMNDEQEERQGKTREKQEKSNIRVVRNEVTVKETGEKKTIGGYDCSHWVITWFIETENTETKERSENTMTSDLWTTPETSEIRALQKEEKEFTEAWLKKIGWDMSNADAQKLGLGMMAGMFGDEFSMQKGAKDVAEKMSKVKGFPIATGIKWRLKSSGGKAEKEGRASGEGVPDIAKGLGGLMSAFGKKAGNGAGSSGDSGGEKTAFESYSEIRKISGAGLSDEDFTVPAGYKKVSP